MRLTRKMFPALATSDHAFLNTGSSGPPPYEVIQAIRETDRLFFGPAYLEGNKFYVHRAEIIARAREAAANLIGANSEDVALTQNTTHGMNLGTFSINWEAGDEVISTQMEHPGGLIPLYALQDRYGVRVNLVSTPVTVEKIGAAMTPKTRLVSLSHIDWTTGEVLPLSEICALTRSQGVLTLVDGAQSVGNIPVDAPAAGVDMYAFTGHKWVLGPEGVGAFYVRPGCDVCSSSLGMAALSDPTAFDYEGNYELHEGARRFEGSTVSVSVGLAAGFSVAANAVEKRGTEGFAGIWHRANLLTELLSELPRVKLHSPQPPHSGLVSFKVEGVSEKEVVELLSEEKFILRSIADPHPCVRASTHLFNTREELEALARAVGEL